MEIEETQENDVQKFHAQNKHTEESTRPHWIL